MTDNTSFKMKTPISRDIQLRKDTQELHRRVEDIVSQLRIPTRSLIHAEEMLYDVTYAQALNYQLKFLLENVEKELRKDLGQEVDEV